MRRPVRLHIKAKKHAVHLSDEPMRCPFPMNCSCSTCRLTLIPGEWSTIRKLSLDGGAGGSGLATNLRGKRNSLPCQEGKESTTHCVFSRSSLVTGLHPFILGNLCL